MIQPAIIDIEASGFGKGSYPIEVGFYLPDGRAYCTLITPEPAWCHWDDSAERVHGIRRELLFEKGSRPLDVCNDLNEKLRGQCVYCDAWAYDYVWLGKLFDAAERVPLFQLKDIRDLLGECEQKLWHATRATVEMRLQLRRHRASSDARMLFETLLEARKRCAPDWT